MPRDSGVQRGDAAWVRGLEADLLERRSEARLRERSNRVARSREFAFVLHSVEKLKQSFATGRARRFSATR